MGRLKLITNKFPFVFIKITLLVLSMHLYGTAGAVRMASVLYSSNNLCLKTSMCNRPKNPHRNPFPKVALLSRVNVTAGSVNTNF